MKNTDCQKLHGCVPVTVIIPAYNPGTTLPLLITELKKSGFEDIITVDDGSKDEYKAIFKEAEKAGARVITHGVNKGKGEALKTGIAAAVLPCVTCDADGQHLPEDVLKTALSLLDNPDSLILGVRDFNASGVPERNRLGNRFSSLFFRLSTGKRCPDTQTGLRGIPLSLRATALACEGSRYEYEMNFLTEAVSKASVIYVPITTVYDNNSTSHFRPVADSLRIYGKPLRFAASSALCAAVDIGLFTVFERLLPIPTEAERIFAATAAARIFSAVLNFLLNKKWSFRAEGKIGRQLVYYGILFVTLILLSSAFVTMLGFIPIPEFIIKAFVDTVLFILSYNVQKRFIFKR